MNLTSRTVLRICRKNYINLRARIEKLGTPEQKKPENILTFQEYRTIVEQAENCSYCGVELRDLKDMEIDHIEPFYHGGNSKATNLIPSCEVCNRAKADQPVQNFLTWLKILGRTELSRGSYYTDWNRKNP